MQERFDGIVLFERKYKENDGLVKIFTEPFGTKMFFVKGLYRPNHKLRSQLLPLTYNRYIGTIHADGLSFLQEGETLNFFRQIQSDYLRQAYATYVTQLTDAALEDAEPNPAVYQILLGALEAINQDLDPAIIILHTELHLLKFFGIHWNWQGCLYCQVTDQALDISLRQQGLLCPRHFDKDAYRLHADPRAVFALRILASRPIGAIQRMDLSQATLAQMRRIVDEIYREYVGIRLRSKRYLEELKKSEALSQALLAKRKKNQ